MSWAPFEFSWSKFMKQIDWNWFMKQFYHEFDVRFSISRRPEIETFIHVNVHTENVWWCYVQTFYLLLFVYFSFFPLLSCVALPLNSQPEVFRLTHDIRTIEQLTRIDQMDGSFGWLKIFQLNFPCYWLLEVVKGVKCTQIKIRNEMKTFSSWRILLFTSI